MKREIFEAYEALTPGEAEREAMLRSILARASAPPERSETMKRKPLIRLLPVAAAVALLLALSVTAYATGWFGLGALGETVTPQTQGFTKEEIAARNAALQEAVANGEDPVKALEELDGQDFPRPVETVRVTSLQGLADTPEAQACLEYLDFLAEYDPDHTILNRLSDPDAGFEEYHGAYTCYTQEMADKIEAVCKKYDLQKLSGRRVGLTQGQLSAAVGPFAPPVNKNAGQFLNGKVLFSDGSFTADGALKLSQHMIGYQVVRSVKGSFVTWYMQLGDPEAWTETQYETANGQTLLIATDGTRALIFAERPESFVVLNVVNVDYKQYRDKPLTEAEIEAFAECFDFTAIP